MQNQKNTGYSARPLHPILIARCNHTRNQQLKDLECFHPTGIFAQRILELITTAGNHSTTDTKHYSAMTKLMQSSVKKQSIVIVVRT